VSLVLLDRDGVIVVNRATNIKTPADIAIIEGAADGIARLNAAGFTVAVCTNQPEVARGVMSDAQLQTVHTTLLAMLKDRGAVIDRVFSCTSFLKCPRRKPSAGMLRDAFAHYGANPEKVIFVGDQADDLKAAFHARCRRALVRTGLGAKTLAAGVPDYLRPFSVHDDLLAAALAIVQGGL
jgi:D-glycero-D-manno-heptose 1,7-bisphosphate phosphatase